MQLNLLRLPVRHEEGQGEGGREVMSLDIILISSVTHFFEWMLFRFLLSNMLWIFIGRNTLRIVSSRLRVVVCTVE